MGIKEKRKSYEVYFCLSFFQSSISENELHNTTTPPDQIETKILATIGPKQHKQQNNPTDKISDAKADAKLIKYQNIT